ncbi:LOW QUALITY PROTEIN: kinesin-like protein KIF13B [Hypomesus transpacificus]|uniref:LOW QUALITY PROTEIN: kinesin-like protein KIF13B n=1 Tax=Hypomesus transpacificus TaxID=137520 RepID=UPI001F0881A2|nr:LOW QUALITY PROTEIN: kinesin-like protein KIF13B [Hypomesus transpacificus]
MDDTGLSDSNVKVAVRVRPMNRREKDLKTKCVVEIEGNQTVLHPASANLSKGDPRNQSKVFAYDYCFWSMDESEKDKFAGQDIVFQSLGESLLDNAFMGYNACIFAYGQTGSGKSYTMMGSAEQPGLSPRLCSVLFERTLREQREGESFTVEVSYMEIYNERVRDLLDPKGSRQTLRVREHKVLGPYVDGLSRLAVASYKDIESLMSEGNKSRTVASTNMNEESSRSHGVFNIILTHTLMDVKSGTSGEKVSKLSLVDLAGSERAAKTGAAGERLKEGSNINKSLSTLGLVISALADQGAGKNKTKFVPYRDSVLTWLLKDSLGGNSRTAMIATISPAADNYDETLSTLRYADRAKSIVNHAVVNEDPNARIIRELREEVDKLRDQLTEAESMKAPELKERLEESEKLIHEMTITWEQKLKKTEAIAQERQKQLESLGISLQSSGIRLVDDKCFLVNLNADPALNELLVYYLKDHTRVGAADSQDIQLCGMAIQAEHCVIDITVETRVVLTPHRNARTCVNGSSVTSPVQLHHGDRILWGNNHFFRINLPRQLARAGAEEEEGAGMRPGLSVDHLDVDLDSASDGSSEVSFSYEFAQTEVMMKTMGSNDPMQAVLQALGRQHEEEKRSALERQRHMYETELQQLRRRLHPERTAGLDLAPPTSATAPPPPAAHNRVRRWSEDREAMMTRSLRRLREQIVRANLLTQEAAFISDELDKKTEYLVTLQIPAANLDANRKRDAVLSEPAVQVRRKGKGKQIWALEKMENRLVDMRELYQEWKDSDEDNPVMRSYFRRADPFFDEQENHSLIGVANVFLACLFHDVKLQYAVPIINQKGEVAGRLHVEVWRGSEGLEENTAQDVTDGDTQERKLKCVVKILQATGLPRHLSNFVFCQYHFWGQEESQFIAPEMEPLPPSPSSGQDPHCSVIFDSTMELEVAVSEDFVEFVSEGALAIEVFGHKQANHRRNLALWDLGVIQAKTRSLRERWSEVTRRLELWVQVMELSEAGEFTPVEVLPAKDVRTGGIFQLKQGQSRRVQVEVKAVQDSGTMPLITVSVLAVSIGNVQVRQASQSLQMEEDEMDSYQEEDLERLKQQWLATLTKRQEYLDQHLQKIVSKADKSEDDVERESQLLECRLTLTEERNSVLVPSAGSGIPGAPAERVPVPGMETHIPVLFLDLSADDFQENLSAPLAGGLDALLSREDEDDFFDLQIVRHHDSEVKAEASWDSTVHSCPQLSRAGAADQRVFLTVRVVVLLSHPAPLQLVLRKRICVCLTGRQGFAQSLLKRMSNRSTVPGCGVTFDIVSNIPGDVQAPEDREMLARLAASTEDGQSADSEAAIEKYLRSILAVENILTLDRLRQEVTVKEQLVVKGKISRRCLSSPSVHRLSGSMRDLSLSTHRLDDFKGWESHQDLSVVSQSRRTLPASSLPQDQHAETGRSGFAASYFPPVPKLLKSLFHGKEKREQTSAPDLAPDPTPQQNLPRIVIQSASVDEFMDSQQLVPIAEIIPPVFLSDALSATPLHYEVITESEDSAPGQFSEASSGYMSTSISTATLSDVYTLTWDTSPPAGSRSEVFDMTINGGHDPQPRPSLDVSSHMEAAARTDLLTTESADPADPGCLPAASSAPSEPLARSGSDGPKPARSNQSNCVSSSSLNGSALVLSDEEPTILSDPVVDLDLASIAPPGSESVVPQGQTKKLEEPPLLDLPVATPAEPANQTDDRQAESSSVSVSSAACDKAGPDQSLILAPPEDQEEPSTQIATGQVAPASTLASASTPAPTSSPPQAPASTSSPPPASALASSPASTTASAPASSPLPVSTPASAPASSPPPASALVSSPASTPASALASSSASTPASAPASSPLPASTPASAPASSPASTTASAPASSPPPASAPASSPASTNASASSQSNPAAALAAANPFKIQKVKTSDLKSFHRILDDEEQGGSASSLGAELSDPIQRLEIISDEEGGTSKAATVAPDWLKVGEFVIVGTNKNGTVRYVGPTEFAEGTWVGVELDVPAGKNDGSVGGRHYFHCNPGYGVMVRPDRVSRGGSEAKRRRQQQKRRSANLSGSSPNLAALTALAKGEGHGGTAASRKGENRKSWNS